MFQVGFQHENFTNTSPSKNIAYNCCLWITQIDCFKGSSVMDPGAAGKLQDPEDDFHPPGRIYYACFFTISGQRITSYYKMSFAGFRKLSEGPQLQHLIISLQIFTHFFTDEYATLTRIYLCNVNSSYFLDY